jgi:adenylate cyclase
MRIRSKFVLVVVPLLITPLLLVGLGASLAARNGITRVATDFLEFKSEELKNYAASQWTLLVENGLGGEQEYIDVSKSAVESFARSLVRSRTELILALEPGPVVAMSTADVVVSLQEAAELSRRLAQDGEGWLQIRLGGVERVAQAAAFEPFGWTFLVTESREVFYRSVDQIYWQAATVLAATLVVALVLLGVFSSYLTRPLGRVVAAMRGIIAANDLSKRVELLETDEIGDLGHTFNLMTAELQKAYNQIKSYAFKAVISQKREQKIRHIFQKFVPVDVIDQFFRNPEAMLTGDNRILAVLFSDIRDFTGISEGKEPQEVVESLNTYFSLMVDIIMSHRGIVDKYIGDAIMAFYGAPVKHADDVGQAVQSGFEMLEALEGFNRRQESRNRPPFRIGVGINYGVVTIGNIGSEKKMDYTVIGDMVNLASRLESATKIYDVPFLVSESVQKRVHEQVPCRLVDTVTVKGRRGGVRIYHPRKVLSQAEEKGWKLHHQGTDLYYKREFDKARKFFQYAAEYLPDDPILPVFQARCLQYIKAPPGGEWNGVEAIPEG